MKRLIEIEYFPPTAEEEQGIRKQDAKVLNEFFLKNYEFIVAACRCCVRKKSIRYTQSDIDELVNECYIHLHEFDLANRRFFCVSVYDTYFFLRKGGKFEFHNRRGFESELSLDKPVTVRRRSGETESGVSLGEMVPSPSAEELEEKQASEERVYDLLDVIRKYLTPREYEVMEYRLLTGLSAAEIGSEVGRTKGAILSQICEAHKKLVFNYRQVLNELVDYEFSESFRYLQVATVPPDYQEVLCSMDQRRLKGRERARVKRSTPEGRLKANEYNRLFWARRKALKENKG